LADVRRENITIILILKTKKRGCKSPVVQVAEVCRSAYRNNMYTMRGDWFAWDSMAEPAC
jgi:hypothetical protein